MTTAHLVACESCARHVRATEDQCPFCGARISEGIRQSSGRAGPAVRLSRAGIVAFGLGALAVPTLATGCSNSSSPGNNVPPYGTPPPLDAGVGDVTVATHYGVPFDAAQTVDAGEEASESGPSDANEDAASEAGSSDANQAHDVGVAVPYGVPVPPTDGGDGG